MIRIWMARQWRQALQHMTTRNKHLCGWSLKLHPHITIMAPYLRYYSRIIQGLCRMIIWENKCLCGWNTKILIRRVAFMQRGGYQHNSHKCRIRKFGWDTKSFGYFFPFSILWYKNWANISEKYILLKLLLEFTLGKTYFSNIFPVIWRKKQKKFSLKKPLIIIFSSHFWFTNPTWEMRNQKMGNTG